MLDELRRLDHLPRRLRNRLTDLVKTRQSGSRVFGARPQWKRWRLSWVDVEEGSDMAALLEPPAARIILPTLAELKATDALCCRRGSAPLDLRRWRRCRTPAHVLSLHTSRIPPIASCRHAGSQRAACVQFAQ